MNALVYDSRSVVQTQEFARQLGSLLSSGDVVCLYGNLGAGKTAFTQGIAWGLGIPREEPIHSPTFTLVAEHLSTRVPLYHFDVYRLTNTSELAALAFDEYLDSEGVMVIEWAGKISDSLPKDRLDIHIDAAHSHNARLFSL